MLHAIQREALTTVIDLYEWLFAFEAIVHFNLLQCVNAPQERLAPVHV